jgi:hypothetical protein
MIPDVNVVGDVGAQLNEQSTFSVSDVTHLTDFTKVCFCYVCTIARTHNSLLPVDPSNTGPVRVGYLGREPYR